MKKIFKLQWYSSLLEVNKEDYINNIKNEIEIAATVLGSKYDFELIDYRTKTVSGEKVISSLYKI